ncbi:hypothetical protein ACLOJK_022918 [Asimina triloba]
MVPMHCWSTSYGAPSSSSRCRCHPPSMRLRSSNQSHSKDRSRRSDHRYVGTTQRYKQAAPKRWQEPWIPVNSSLPAATSLPPSSSSSVTSSPSQPEVVAATSARADLESGGIPSRLLHDRRPIRASKAVDDFQQHSSLRSAARTQQQ